MHYEIIKKLQSKIQTIMDGSNITYNIKPETHKTLLEWLTTELLECGFLMDFFSGLLTSCWALGAFDPGLDASPGSAVLTQRDSLK